MCFFFLSCELIYGIHDLLEIEIVANTLLKRRLLKFVTLKLTIYVAISNMNTDQYNSASQQMILGSNMLANITLNIYVGLSSISIKWKRIGQESCTVESLWIRTMKKDMLIFQCSTMCITNLPNTTTNHPDPYNITHTNLLHLNTERIQMKLKQS